MGDKGTKKTPFKRGEVKMLGGIKPTQPLYPKPTKDWDLTNGQK